MNHKLTQSLTPQQSLIEIALRKHLPTSSNLGAGQLNKAIGYALFPGGRRWRPLFTLLGTALTRRADLTADSEVLMVACAIEFLHTSAIILDDLPAMDDANLRRGKPALHLVFGEDLALLAALALLNQSYALFAKTISAKVAQKLIQEASFCIGSEGMIGGQAVDLCSDKELSSQLNLRDRNLKTTALTTLMMTAGAITVGAQNSDVAALAHFGECVGLAYQIYDDLLDVGAAGAGLGKTIQQDVRHSRPSAVSNMGNEKAAELAISTLEDGIAVLQKNFVTCQALSTIIAVARYLFTDLEKIRNTTVEAKRSCDDRGLIPSSSFPCTRAPSDLLPAFEIKTIS